MAHRWTGKLDMLITKMNLEKYAGQNIYEVILN